MSTQDNLERILRQMHVLISKGETFENSKDKVVIKKQDMLDLLKDLNICVYHMMEEYEMTQQSHDQAEREAKKLGEKIVKNAEKQAEDVYAASVLYTNEALDYVQKIMQDATDSMEEAFTMMRYEMEKRKSVVKENQLELEGHLHDLADTNKYMQLIQERNREIEKEKTKEKIGKKKSGRREGAYPKPEIKINKDYFIQNGIPLEENEESGENEEKEEQSVEKPEIKVNLDAEYFKWKKGQKKN